MHDEKTTKEEPKTADEVRQWVVKKLEESMKKFPQQSLDSMAEVGIRSIALEALKKVAREYPGGCPDAIEVRVKVRNDEADVIPENLYTFLLLKGFRPDYELVKNEMEYKTPHGTYGFKDGKCYFTSIKPLQSIIFQTKIGE